MENLELITYQGTITNISEVEKFKSKQDPSKEFMKKTLTVNCTVGKGEWIQDFDYPFECWGKSISKLQGFSVGEDVKVTFKIKARNGFVNLNLVGLDKADGNQATNGLDFDPSDENDQLPF